MKHRTLAASGLFLLLTLALNPFLQAELPAYTPELFKGTRLVYEDSFDAPLNPAFWEVRQSSTWAVREGVLTGSPAAKEFQDKMIAKGDKAHAGLKPVIWLRQVPENFVCVLRMRYNAEAYHPKFPLLDLGHHIHTLTFGERKTTLTIKKDVEVSAVEVPHLPLNQWVDVVIELKKGTLLLKIDGQKHLFTSPHIDMAGQQQIDFKGVDFGSCQIDHIQLWQGL